jgi:hypothetical protein
MNPRLMRHTSLMLGQILVSPLQGEERVTLRLLKLAGVRRKLSAHAISSKILRARALPPCVA